MTEVLDDWSTARGRREDPDAGGPRRTARASSSVARAATRRWHLDGDGCSTCRGAVTGTLAPAPGLELAAVANRTFEAIVFDWDGTAVPDRRSDAADVRARVEALCAAGVHVFVVSGTHVGNIDGQLRARPAGPGRLHLCVEPRLGGLRGRERTGPSCEWRRTASRRRGGGAGPGRRAGRGAARRSGRGRPGRLQAAEPPQDRPHPRTGVGRPAQGPHRRAPRGRHRAPAAAGMAGSRRGRRDGHGAAQEAGLDDPRITTDGKHVEIGLTDKSDSARWAARWLAERGITGG